MYWDRLAASHLFMVKIGKIIAINLLRLKENLIQGDEMQILVILRNGKVGVRILVCCCEPPCLCNNNLDVCQQQMRSLQIFWKKYYGGPQISQKLGVRWESVGSACGLLESAS